MVLPFLFLSVLLSLSFMMVQIVSLSNVLHVPHLSHNLISISQIAGLGYTITFSSSSYSIVDPYTSQRIGTNVRVRGLY